jgi:cell wall-associated NlpC family hydrolase
MAVYQNFGISLPHNAAAQSGYGTSVSMDNLQPGDLLFYNGDGGIGHVSIYIGGGQIIDAIPGGVAIRDVNYMNFIGGGPVL